MPCIMPEMPYCPVCKYGYISYSEQSDTDSEWICLCTDEDILRALDERKEDAHG